MSADDVAAKRARPRKKPACDRCKVSPPQLSSCAQADRAAPQAKRVLCHPAEQAGESCPRCREKGALYVGTRRTQRTQDRLTPSLLSSVASPRQSSGASRCESRSSTRQVRRPLRGTIANPRLLDHLHYNLWTYHRRIKLTTSIRCRLLSCAPSSTTSFGFRRSTIRACKRPSPTSQPLYVERLINSRNSRHQRELLPPVSWPSRRSSRWSLQSSATDLDQPRSSLFR